MSLRVRCQNFVVALLPRSAMWLCTRSPNRSPANPTVGRFIGVAPVRAGENSNVSVFLTAAVKSGTRLIFMLHEESHGNTTFDPPRDKFVFANGKLVMKSITVLK